MNINNDINNLSSVKSSRVQAASTFGANTSGKDKDKDVDQARKDEEIKKQLQMEKDTVKLSQSEGAKNTAKSGMQELKKKKEKEAKNKLNEFVKSDIFKPTETNLQGKEEAFLTPTAELTDITYKKPEDITKGLPSEVEKASRNMVEKQINPETNRPNNTLTDIKKVDETKIVNETLETSATIADIIDKKNEPMLMNAE